METTDSWQWITDVGSGYSRMRPLDEGGMGTLYRAHKDSLDVGRCHQTGQTEVSRPDG